MPEAGRDQALGGDPLVAAVAAAKEGRVALEVAEGRRDGRLVTGEHLALDRRLAEGWRSETDFGALKVRS